MWLASCLNPCGRVQADRVRAWQPRGVSRRYRICPARPGRRAKDLRTPEGSTFGHALDRPLLVFEPLRAGYQWASDRLHRFVIEGMGDNERAFGSRGIAQAILVAAFLSLFKVFNGNFVAASRLLYATGRRGLVHPSLAHVHPSFGTPAIAVILLAMLTAGASFLGDAVLIPITEVGSLAVGVGWLSACVAWLVRSARAGERAGRLAAPAGAAVSGAIVVMKIVPIVPGSFGVREWVAFLCWCALGFAFWLGRKTQPAGARAGSL